MPTKKVSTSIDATTRREPDAHDAEAALPIPLGNLLASPDEEPLVLWTDDPDLLPHVGRPWLRAYAAATLGADLPKPPAPGGNGLEVSASAFCLDRHACLFGASGSGKSRLALHLITEQVRRGCSVVAFDPKRETVARLLQCVQDAGLPPERIVLLDPSDPDAPVPGWNPLQTDIPPAQAAYDFVSTLAQKHSDSWGPRLEGILTAALVLLAAHGLSLYELPALLGRPEFGAGLAARPLPPNVLLPGGGRAAATQARAFFAHEFLSWAKADRIRAVDPVLNKTRALLGSDFLQALLCARRNTLDLASLWRTPGAVIVHLDGTALGDDGASLLGGLLAHHLFRTSMRQTPGPIPVVLALDEIAAQEKFIGAALTDIVTQARGQGLRLLAASQHLAGLSGGLRAALLGNTAVRIFFRLGPEDARAIAGVLATGAAEPLCRATAEVASRDRSTGLAQRSVWRHRVLDAHGNALRLSPDAWDDFRRQQMVAAPGEGYALRRVQELAGTSGVPRLFVRAPDTGGYVALTKYVADLPETDYWFDGPEPLELSVSFPKPRFSHAQRRSASDVAGRWADALINLPVQHAAVWLLSGERGEIRVVDVPGVVAGVPEGRSRMTAPPSGQTWEEAWETVEWRDAQIERVAAGKESAAPSVPSAHVPASFDYGRVTPAGQPELFRAAGTDAGTEEDRNDRGSVQRPLEPKTGTLPTAAPYPAEEVDADGSLT